MYQRTGNKGISPQAEGKIMQICSGDVHKLEYQNNDKIGITTSKITVDTNELYN